MKIAMIGTGYVGLVTGTCLSETGHTIVCVDKIRDKIEALQSGRVPIYEPGLEELLIRNHQEGRLSFTTDVQSAVQDAELIFLAVGTPPLPDGSPNLQFLDQACREAAGCVSRRTMMVVKSTVPVGTCDGLQELIRDLAPHPVELISNPEFLKEGAAVDDFMKPDRVVVGVVSREAEGIMTELYAPFVRTGHPILVMDRRSAELSKYVANAMLASRISFMNEMANLAESMGADIDLVRQGVGADSRIGMSFLFPGLGYGGSCFPKDVRAMIHMGKQQGMDMAICAAVHAVNDRQKEILVNKAMRHFQGDVRGRRIALWGLSFKPRTDDVREAPSLVTARKLAGYGAEVRVFDPEAMETARVELGDLVLYCQDEYEATQDADALMVVTEWNQFRRPDLARLKAMMKHPVIFDGRNIFTPKRIRDAGFVYYSIGRG